MIGYYLTHPQVVIDPGIPTPRWSLSERGRERIAGALTKPWWRSLGAIISSDEQKAVETAALVGAAAGVKPQTGEDMGENDRSTTGFLTPDKFEAAADAFFADPATSWRGWETAIAAQARIVSAVDAALTAYARGAPILLVGHGAVGTLLKCHIAARPIDRSQDQLGGGGNIFAFTLEDRRLLCDWTPIETFEGATA